MREREHEQTSVELSAKIANVELWCEIVGMREL